jgi:hypothetical protein
MTDDPQVFAAKQCALEITAYLQRTHAVEIPPDAITDMARRIHQVIVSETDEYIGVLRRFGQILGPDGPDRPPVVREALRIISDAGIEYEE